uniref:Uncharacterized protein n=1 Tax=Panstrongylus lignarius TaxID=156445 RepID=A0A224Y326_9HEMI
MLLICTVTFASNVNAWFNASSPFVQLVEFGFGTSLIMFLISLKTSPLNSKYSISLIACCLSSEAASKNNFANPGLLIVSLEK